MTSRHDPARFRTGLLSVWLWWTAFAAMSGVGLHAVATDGVPDATPEAVRVLMIKLAPLESWQGLAATGQYALPAACGVVALLLTLLGWIRGREAKARSGDAPVALAKMDSREFDALLVDAFKLQGYQLVSTGGGVDMVLRKDHETCLVQSKQWRVDKVGVQPLRDLFAMMGTRGAASGIVVTAGRFSREATQYAATHSLKLVEGAVLLAMIKRARTERSKTSGQAPVAASVPAPTVPPKAWLTSVPPALIPIGDVLMDEEVVIEVPPLAMPHADQALAVDASALPKRCPKCGAGMVLRKVRSGPKAGRPVWSCETYPACRGARRAS